MAKSNSTQSTLTRSEAEAIRNFSMDRLIALIEEEVEEIDEKSNQVLAVAYGGENWAGRPDTHGDAVDLTAMYMFKNIINMKEDARAYYSLKDAIAELRFRVSEQAKQCNSSLTIAGSAQ